MAQLSQLIPTLVGIPEVRMSTMGHLLWISWQKTLPGAINQTLENYGGMQIYVNEDQQQAIWFFFTSDVFLVLARLIIWGHFNELPVCVEVFPGRLQLDRRGEISLLMDAALQNQEVVVPDKLEVWVHKKSCEGHNAMPGIEFELRRARQGMASADWVTPVVDMRMPFASTQSWIVVLHPLGSPLEKDFIDGWYAMFKRIDLLLQKHKVKSIVENYFVILAMENLLMLRSFMRDYLLLVREMDNEGTVWPCVIAITDRANLNFNGDVPQKINLHWAKLVAGFPYISYRNAYLLGKAFNVRDLRFSGDQMTMDAWCNIQLADHDLKTETLPLLMPGKLTESLEDVGECFFCGLSNHTTFNCPTLGMDAEDGNIWDEMASYDLTAINKAFQQIEKNLETKERDPYTKMLAQHDIVSALLKGIFELLKLSQLRYVQDIWLYRLREPDPLDPPLERDDSMAWEYLDALKSADEGDIYSLHKKLTELLENHARDARLHTMAGFAAVGKKEYAQAKTLFKRAAVLTSNVPIEAWNEFLAARVEEVEGHYANAITQYHQVMRIIPDPLECRYRALVCRVKMGFVEQTLDEILALVKERHSFFNRFLIDPGLERGRILILQTLHSIWKEAETAASHEQGKVRSMRIRFDDWFPEDHLFRGSYEPKLVNLERLSNVRNYIAFLHLVEVRPELEEELNSNIEKEVEDLRSRYKAYLNALQTVRDEFSWFPFPSALKEFGDEFNEAASILNWAYSSDFNDVQIFRQATSALSSLDRLLRKLQRRLHSLRLVRDGTLFAMTMGKTFMFTEILILVISLVFILVVGFFGDSLHLGWLKSLIVANKVSILEVLVLVVTLMALGISALRTTLVLDSRRDKLVERARINREVDQQNRLNKIKQRKREKAEQLKREKAEERQAELRQELRERMHLPDSHPKERKV